ncbi:MAG TPA: hypothetical protein VMT46_15770 [Anaerolineaceae bacterium]|nr:hypothetical protein [Anaerolineaceae bacterium]
MAYSNTLFSPPFDPQKHANFHHKKGGLKHGLHEQVLEPIVAVETAPSLAYLDRPRLYSPGRRPDRDCTSGIQNRIWDQLIAGPAPLYLRTSKSPGEYPRSQGQDVGGQRQPPGYRAQSYA